MICIRKGFALMEILFHLMYVFKKGLKIISPNKILISLFLQVEMHTRKIYSTDLSFSETINSTHCSLSLKNEKCQIIIRLFSANCIQRR